MVILCRVELGRQAPLYQMLCSKYKELYCLFVPSVPGLSLPLCSLVPSDPISSPSPPHEGVRMAFLLRYLMASVYNTLGSPFNLALKGSLAYV